MPKVGKNKKPVARSRKSIAVKKEKQIEFPVPVTGVSMVDRHPEAFVITDLPSVSGIITRPLTYVRLNKERAGRVLRVVYKDTPLDILSEEQDGWVFVKTKDDAPVEGYVKAEALS